MKRLLLTIVLVLISFSIAADDKPKNYNGPVDMSIDHGIMWLSDQQNEDGSWGEDYAITATSLTCLAMMGEGNFPDNGEYGDQVERGIMYLLRSQRRKGYITEPGLTSGASRMHGHSYAMLALAEFYGMQGRNSRFGAHLKKAIKKGLTIFKVSQSPDGGWGYDPIPLGTEENSITVCVVQAMRSARNAGFAINKKIINKGLKYLNDCMNEDGSFGYRIAGKASSFSHCLTAGAVAAFYCYGEGDSEGKGIEYMRGFDPAGRRYVNSRLNYYYYEMFYTTQAYYYADGENTKSLNKVRNILLRFQTMDGNWGELKEVGDRSGSERYERRKELSTAFAILSLQVPRGVPPIFQD